ncbi:type II toxin-antitoxin system RelE/ParE family toxin [Candidatus Peregrinibacteria bacterium]|nr:type II toxin-antitoxin system RelE/ParE family toxin [Candidatus Peregrinibacteria bacterium]
MYYESKALLRDRKKLFKDKSALLFIQESIGKLALDPFSHILNIKKLRVSEEAVFRLRCGKWRILYDVDSQNKIIIIYRIMQRKEGY